MKQDIGTMTRKFRAIPALALVLAVPALAASPEAAPTAQAQDRASIPFADNGGIRDWQAGEDDNILYVQDRHRQWYKATLMSPAFSIGTQWAIGFDAGAAGTFDRFSHVIVDGQRHAIQSLVRIDAPPSRDKDED